MAKKQVENIVNNKIPVVYERKGPFGWRILSSIVDFFMVHWSKDAVKGTYSAYYQHYNAKHDGKFGGKIFSNRPENKKTKEEFFETLPDGKTGRKLGFVDIHNE